VGGYAAANSFLDSFTHYQNSQNKLTSYCFSWSMWDDTGMSQGYQMKNLIRAKGFHIMSSSQAISSMLASLHHQQHNLLIGLDGSNQNIQRWQSSGFNLQKLTAYFTTNTKEFVKLPGLKVQDHFGNVCIYESVQLPEMPYLKNGEIDRARLIKKSNNNDNRERIEPRNEIELKIAQCWQQVLKVPLLGIHDNFFELGGNSLLAGQVIARLREDFSLELSLQRLLQAPTIVALAQTIEAIQRVTQSQNTFIKTLEQEYEEDFL
jgi:acyl carrier protein